MDITIQPRLQENSQLADLARKASPLLPPAIGSPAARVKAIWDIAKDEHGRDMLELTLSDWTGSLTRRYSPEDFRDEPRLSWQFIRQWGDLLQNYSKRRIKEMELAFADTAEE